MEEGALGGRFDTELEESLSLFVCIGSCFGVASAYILRDSPSVIFVDLFLLRSRVSS